ncbi:hypothetical protein IFM89_021599 [Coptis chinensis]|uniref:Uncharacterized protein n=1 Tax=Coptis chinensis TaxID=261450 RepID=A0A835IFY4_9MAGN|nr:hypothetical protein IFM89_021599 [Coptis chinensis]
MQRQSLSSPGSKLNIHEENDEEEKKSKVGKEVEIEKLITYNHSTKFRADKSIHLIPLLTVFCFLILYLVSHDPLQQELVHINGFKRPNLVLETEKSDVLAIRSYRSLQEIKKRGLILHRKMGDF